MSEKADFEPIASLKRASHFVKIIVACPHHLPKLPESTLCKQGRPNNGSLFCSHCDKDVFQNSLATKMIVRANFCAAVFIRT
jgi:hypothetical protein